MTKTRRPQRRPPIRTPPPPSVFAVTSVCGVAVAAAVLERWSFVRAWGESGSLSSIFYFGDASRFVAYAVAMLQGKPFDNGIPYHPPGWPLALAAFMRAAGAVHGAEVVVPVAAVKLFIACLSGVTVGVAALLAYEMAGFGAMLAVAVLGPFHFGHIVEGTAANSEALYGLFVIVALWTVWRWLQESAAHRMAWAALAGAVGGMAMVVRPEFLACAGVLMMLAAWVRRPGWLREAAVFGAVFCAVLAPTTVWHWRTLSAFNAAHIGRVAGPLPRFAPVTSYGPFNFAMANHPDADGGPNRDHPMLDQCNQETDARLSAGELDLQCPAVYDLYVHGYANGAVWLIDHPAAALDLLTRKVAFGVGFLAQGYFIDDRGAGVDGVRRRVDLFDPDLRGLLPIHLLLIAGGALVLRRRPLALGVIAAPAVALVASTVLFYGYVRLGTAYLPAFWVLQGAALSAIARRAARPNPVAAAAAVIATVAVLATWDGVRAGRRHEVRLDGPRGANGELLQDETVSVRHTENP